MRGSLQRLIVEQGRIIKEFRNHQRLFVTRITNFCCCLKIQDVSQSRRWHQRKGSRMETAEIVFLKFQVDSQNFLKFEVDSQKRHRKGFWRRWYSMDSKEAGFYSDS